MAFQFPWTNLHELNLDWFLSKFKQFTDNYLGTTATAESVPYGTQPSVTVTGGELDEDTDVTDPFTFNFKIPAGEQGEQGVPGTPGQDGFSPIATVTKSGDTATITITDAQGTTSATISDGDDFYNSVRPVYSAFMDELTAVKSYPVNNGRQITVNKNHITVTRTGTGTSFGLLSLIGSGLTFVSGAVTDASYKALYNAGEFIPKTHILYDTANYPWSWFFNLSMERPAGSGEGGYVSLVAYDTVNETTRILAQSGVSSSFTHTESSSSFIVNFSTLTADEVIMVVFQRRSGTTSYTGVAIEWDWSIESARGFGDAIDRQNNNLAYTESDNLASRAYTPGNYFINQTGALCKITAPVANGATLVSGTNYTTVGSGGGLNDFGISYHATTKTGALWQYAPVSGVTVTVNSVHTTISGNIVNVAINLINPSGISANTDIVTGLPKPSENTLGYNVATLYDHDAGAMIGYGLIYQSGNYGILKTLTAIPNGHRIRISTTYSIN